MIKINDDKILIFSDLHIGRRQNNVELLTQDQEYIDWLIKQGLKNNIKSILFLGDFFHSRTSLNVNTMNESYAILKKLTKHFTVYLIIGNHDIFYKTKTDVHSLKGFSDMENLELIDRTEEMSVNGKNFLLCPFHWEVPTKKYDAMFGHFEMAGAQMAGGLSEDKMHMRDLVKHAPIVFSGHYHIRKEYNFKNGRVLTVGNPFQQDWGDYKNEKGLYIVDTKTLEYDFIKNDISPEHIKVYWSNLPEDLAFVNGHYIKLVIDKKFKFDEVNAFIIKLRTSGAKNVNPEFLYSFKDTLNEGNKSLKKAYTKSEYIKNYIDDLPEIGGLTKEQILETFINYFKVAEETSVEVLALNANNIVFDNISIQNYKSIGERVSMAYAEHSGVWLVQGQNNDTGCSVGSGKTSIISAIVFALYGKDLKNTKNKYIKNRLMVSSELDCEVVLQFRINNVQYKISTGFYFDCRGMNCHLWRMENGEWNDITKSSVKETLRFVEYDLLKCSYGLFKSSIYLCGQDYNSFFTMSKSGKRAFLEDIFNLKIFGAILSLVRKDRIVDQTTLNELEHTIVQNNKTIKELQNEDAKFEDTKIADIKSIEDNILKLEGDLSKIDSTKIKENLKKIESKLVKADKIEAAHIKNKVLIKTKQTGINNAKNDIKYYTKLNGKFEKTLEIVCKDCIPQIKNEYKIQENEEFIETNIYEQQNLEKELEKVQVNFDKLDKALITLQKVKDVKTKLDYELKYNTNTKNDLEQRIENNKNSLTEAKSKTNSLSAIIKSRKKENKEGSVLVNALYEKLKMYDIIENISSEDGVKTYIMDDLIHVLNKLMTRYLNDMGAEFQITFDTNFDVEFLTSSGECSFNNFSGGEKTMVEMSAMFSFRRLLYKDGIRSNLTAMDELFDSGISNSQCVAFLSILKKEAKKDQAMSTNVNTMFIITHKNFDANEFDGIITIEKNNGISTLV